MYGWLWKYISTFPLGKVNSSLKLTISKLQLLLLHDKNMQEATIWPLHIYVKDFFYKNAANTPKMTPFIGKSIIKPKLKFINAFEI